MEYNTFVCPKCKSKYRKAEPTIIYPKCGVCSYNDKKEITMVPVDVDKIPSLKEYISTSFFMNELINT